MTVTPRAITRQGARGSVARAAVLTLVAVLTALIAAGCASPVLAPGTSGDPSSSIPPEPADRIHQQAHDALARWADAVRQSGGASITFTDELSSVIGGFDTDDQKLAFMAGEVVTAKPIPNERSRGQVKWVEGATIDVNVLSAAAALQALVDAGEGDCGGCAPLHVTGADLASSLVDTSRGPAEVPTWVFSVAGLTARLTRVAVDESVTITPPPWNADDPPIGISIESATGSADSRKLEVSFIGAPGDASKSCGADYTAEGVESELAVVVIVLEHRNAGSGACTLVGAIRTARLTLASRLGDRTVLEIKQGLPVPVVAPS